MSRSGERDRSPATATPGRPLRIFIVAGEHSGDQLGFKLMRALSAMTGDRVSFRGVGGEAMAREGLVSLFPLDDIAVMGILPVIRRLPGLVARIGRTARCACEWPPDILVLIDSPDFTHRVARRVRRHLPHLPVVDYVSPSVWAWRPGRARKMRRNRSTMCWRSCPSSLRRMRVSAGPPALMSATL